MFAVLLDHMSSTASAIDFDLYCRSHYEIFRAFTSAHVKIHICFSIIIYFFQFYITTFSKISNETILDNYVLILFSFLKKKLVKLTKIYLNNKRDYEGWLWVKSSNSLSLYCYCLTEHLTMNRSTDLSELAKLLTKITNFKLKKLKWFLGKVSGWKMDFFQNKNLSTTSL